MELLASQHAARAATGLAETNADDLADDLVDDLDADDDTPVAVAAVRSSGRYHRRSPVARPTSRRVAADGARRPDAAPAAVLSNLSSIFACAFLDLERVHCFDALVCYW